MREKIVAVSVSDGPDLQTFGFLPQHLRRLLASLASAILRKEWRVGYGGDLRRDGFTRSLLADMAAAYTRGEINQKLQAPIVHFFAFSSWRGLSSDAILNHLLDKELGPEDAPIAPILETRFFLPVSGQPQLAAELPRYLPVVVEDGSLRNPETRDRIEPGSLLAELATAVTNAPEDPSLDLTAMRRAMGAACPLRIQFSGRITGYSGRQPGIFEEALEQIKAEGLLLPLAAFGGAAREVAIALRLLGEQRRRYLSYGRNYEESFHTLQSLAERYRESAGDLWPIFIEATNLSEPHRIVFHLTEILSDVRL